MARYYRLKLESLRADHRRIYRESIKKENTCLAAELPGPEKPVRSPEESGNEDRDCGLFSCPELGCVKQYITMGKLEKHIAAEKHNWKTNFLHSVSQKTSA